MRLRRMPLEVRTLRLPWRALAGEVEGLTDGLERDFRFGHRVTRTERGFLLGGTIKGGSSSMWVPVDELAHRAYLAWRVIEGMRPETGREGYERLKSLLDLYGIEIAAGDTGRVGPPGAIPPPARTDAFRPEHAGIHSQLHAILRELPPSHLERKDLGRIQLGGWGPDAAKVSCYEAGSVILYDTVLRGARRALSGIFLHELGHAHEAALSEKARAALVYGHGAIARADAFYGIDFLVDPPARRAYQRLSSSEFAAELYLAYTACGAGLREFIAGQKLGAREAWQRVYVAFRETFEGVEYE